MKPLSHLEILIRQIAGRDDASPSELVERNDPTSDASRFFEEIRRRTRMLLDVPAAVEPASAELARADRADPGEFPGSERGRYGPLIRKGTVLLLLFLLGLGVTGSLVWQQLDRVAAERSRRLLEQSLVKIQTELAGRPPLDAAKIPGSDPLALVLDRLETGLTALATKVDALGRTTAAVDQPGADMRSALTNPVPLPPAPGTENGLAALSSEFAAIRRELISSEAATTRQLQEMRTVLQEVNTVVRRVLSRPQSAPASNVTLPLLIVTVQALINNLQNPSAQVRGEAVEQLMRIGSPARSAIPALQHRLNSEADANVRTAIEAAINVLSSN